MVHERNCSKLVVPPIQKSKFGPSEVSFSRIDEKYMEEGRRVMFHKLDVVDPFRLELEARIWMIPWHIQPHSIY